MGEVEGGLRLHGTWQRMALLRGWWYNHGLTYTTLCIDQLSNAETKFELSVIVLPDIRQGQDYGRT